MRTRWTVQDEARLAAACARGDPVAWNQLVTRFEPYLLRCVARCSHAPCPDWEKAKEVVQQVWVWLAEKHGEPMLRFDPTKQRLAAFLSRRARHRLRNHLRSEQNRAARQTAVAHKLTDAAIELPLQLTLDDFATQLTPHQGQLLQWFVSSAGAWPSAASARKAPRQRTLERVAAKFVLFVHS